MSGEELRAAPLTSGEALRRSGFSEYRKVGTTRISDITFPPGTVYETPEGLHTDDEETRCAFDVQGGIYPIRESVFRSVYALAAPSTSEPSGPIDYNPYPNPFHENGDFIDAAPSTPKPSGETWTCTCGHDEEHHGTVCLDCDKGCDVTVYGAAPSTPEPSGLLEATCVCGANPPRRPWSAAYRDDPCLDGNGNFRAGHGYLVAPSTPKPSGTICKCGLAKTYHEGGFKQDHEYEPRYPAAPSTEPALDVRTSPDDPENPPPWWRPQP